MVLTTRGLDRSTGTGGRHRAAGPPSWQGRYIAGIIVTDALTALMAGGLGFVMRFGAVSSHNQLYVVLFLVSPMIWVLACTIAGAYDPRFLFVGTSEYQRIVHAGIGVTASTALVSYSIEFPTSRAFVLVAIPVCVFLSMTARFVWRKWLHAVRATGRCVRRVILIGHEGPVTTLTRQLRREHFHGLHVVGACLPSGYARGPFLDFDAPVFGDFSEAGRAVLAARADTVIVLSCPELDGPALRRLAWRLERGDVELMMASALLDIGGARTSIRPVDGLPMLQVEHARLTGAARVAKNVFDRFAAVVLLAFLWPLLVGCAVAVKLSSPGPVLFCQERIGRDGRSFMMWKFRSMVVDASKRLAEIEHLNESQVLFKVRDDPRVTDVGRILRRLSLDELPQLWNVVRGDMSLVGPRPPLRSEVEAYPDDARRRLVVKPGITGLWQISGRSDLSWDESVRLDLRYVEHWSLSLDLVILARTVAAVVRASGAY